MSVLDSIKRGLSKAFSLEFIPVRRTQDLVPIYHIDDENGIIIDDDENLLFIIEFSPPNTETLEISQLSNMAENFNIALLNEFPNEFQLKVSIERANVDKHIENVREDIKGDDSEGVHILAQEYERLVLEETISWRNKFQLILKQNKLDHQGRSLKDRTREFQGDIVNVVSFLRGRMGATIHKYDGEKGLFDSDYSLFQLEILYKYYNPVSSERFSIEERVEGIIRERNREMGGSIKQNLEFTVADYVAPTSFKQEHPAYLMADGYYYSAILVTPDMFPDEIFFRWAQNMVPKMAGVEVDYIIDKTIQKGFSTTLRKSGKRQRRMASTGTDTDVFSEMDHQQAAVEENFSMWASLVLSQGYEPMEMVMIISIRAATIGELNTMTDAVILDLEKMEYDKPGLFSDIGPTLFRQKELFYSTAPICRVPEGIKEIGAKEISSANFAIGFPFNASSISDENGVALGRMTDNSLIIFDQFNTDRLTNYNILILAATGSGKTFTMGVLALRSRIRGMKTIIITPVKGSEFYKAARFVDGSIFNVAPASGKAFNIMEIIPQSEDAMLVTEESNPLTSKFNTLKQFATILVGGKMEISPYLDRELTISIRKTYEKYDMYEDDPSSIYIGGSRRRGLKRMPILGDWFDTLRESPAYNRPDSECNERQKKLKEDIELFLTFAYLVEEGEFRSLNQRTNIDYSNKFLQIELSALMELKGSIAFNLGLFITLYLVNQIIAQDIYEKKVVYFDEMWQLLSDGTDETKMLIISVWKLIRGLGGSAVGATQDLADLTKDEDTAIMVDNSDTIMIMISRKKALDGIQKAIGLTDEDVRTVMNFDKRGSILMKSGAHTFTFRVEPTELELALLTTDNYVRAKLVEERTLDKYLPEHLAGQIMQ